MAFVLMSGAAAAAPEGVLVEAESFADRGGWSVDQQFVDRMGSPFLLAHGLGRPVADAVTSVELAPGTYRLWVRTRDWCRPMAESGPGRFAVLVDGRECETYGVGGSGAWEVTKTADYKELLRDDIYCASIYNQVVFQKYGYQLKDEFRQGVHIKK